MVNLAVRRGGKKAAIAVAHTILVIADHLLKHKRTYQELGSDHFDQINRERVHQRIHFYIWCQGVQTGRP